MKSKLLYLIAVCFLLPVVSLAEETKNADDKHDEYQSVFSEGKFYLNTRYRFEHVDQDGVLKNAKASTLRTRLGFNSGEFQGFSFKVEVEDVSEIGEDTFNNTINGRSDFPVVADPDGTELNEAYISYQGFDDTVVRAGREALKLDNLRFVGDVAWRQNNQTYDGVNVTNTSIEDLKLFYAFVGNVNRIFGEDSPAGDFNTSLNLFNARYSGLSAVTLAAYAYLLDIDDAPALSSSTVGLHAWGETEVSDSLSVIYDGEYAYQQDYEDNPTNYDAQYWRAAVGAKTSGFVVKGGLESLGSDDGMLGFSTPFATLHAWNGWADKFLATPATGLEDAFLSVQYSVKEPSECIDKLSFQTVYHYFSSEENSSKYGEEWDFSLVADFREHFSAGVKYAVYDSASFATDTEKLIFTLAAKFSQ